jgi:hypothetical protein
MSNPTIQIHNSETDEVTNREMTDAEYTAWLDRKAIDDAKAEQQAKAEADKVAAQAKLEALGLTSDDLKALGL